jgi:hypothetical protein
MKKKIIKITILLLILLVGLGCLNNLFLPEERGNDIWKSFYELPKDTIDMLFIGSSHCFTGFVPMIFNKTLKLDSYHLGMEGTSIEQVYFILVEALKTQKPNFVIIELYSIRPIGNSIEEAPMIHSSLDGMKLNKNKIEAVNLNVDQISRLDYLFLLTKNHTYWKDIDMSTLLHSRTSNINYFGYKNQLLTPYKIKGEKIVEESSELYDVKYLPQNRIDILEDIEKICSDNGIELIYVNIPFIEQLEVSQTELAQYINGIESYSERKHVQILDYSFFDDIGLDKTHLTDDGHTNIEGAYLVSTHLANYIGDNYSESLKGINYDLKADTEQKLAEYLSELAEFKENSENH